MTLSQLRALAAAATPGPWTPSAERGGVLTKFKLFAGVFYKRDTLLLKTPRDEDAAYIAALSPEVVTALCDVAEASEALLIPSAHTSTNGEKCRGCVLDAALSRLQEVL